MINTQLLKGKIVSAGLTQAALSKKVGMSRSNMNAKMNGHFSFTIDEVVRICDVLGIVDPAEKEEIFLSRSS